MPTIRIRFAVVLLAALCCASLALAQDTFTFNGVATGYSMGANPDVYVSPYLATITNGSTQVYSGLAICDDFNDEIGWGESWTVQSETVGGSLSGSYFGSGVFNLSFMGLTVIGSSAYNAVAWLASQLVNPASYTNADTASELSYAIWSIFDPAAYNNLTATADQSLSQVQAAVKADITAALGDGTYTGPAVTIWTPTGYTPGAANAPQEFITVSTPEAPMLASLALDFGALLGIVFVVRRRVLKGRQAA